MICKRSASEYKGKIIRQALKDRGMKQAKQKTAMKSTAGFIVAQINNLVFMVEDIYNENGGNKKLLEVLKEEGFNVVEVDDKRGKCSVIMPKLI